MNGPVTREHHFQLLNAYQNDPSYKAVDSYEAKEDFFETLIGRKWEIDAETYDDALNVLQPMGWRGGTFYISERLFGDITSRFSQEGGRYYHEYAPFPSRKSLDELFDTATKADEAFQTALELAFGEAAGEVRYQAKLQPPAIRQLGDSYVRASERYTQALQREQRKQARRERPEP